MRVPAQAKILPFLMNAQQRRCLFFVSRNTFGKPCRERHKNEGRREAGICETRLVRLRFRRGGDYVAMNVLRHPVQQRKSALLKFFLAQRKGQVGALSIEAAFLPEKETAQRRTSSFGTSQQHHVLRG